MTTRIGAAAAIAILALASAACTGGTESNAAEEQTPAAQTEQQKQQQQVDAKRELSSISPAIPIYHGAEFSADLSQRDAVSFRNQYGPDAKVFTLSTDDSYPQVYHFYTTYLGQFRAFSTKDTYPPEKQTFRTLEVQLNQAMQDPFIPGQDIDPNGKQVTLQIAETEAEPKTVIRYVVTSRPITTTAPANPAATPVAAAAPVAPVAR